MSDKDQKTHDPTQKRIDDARKKGDVPTSSEVKHIAVFAGMLVVLGGMGVHAFARMGGMLVRLWGRADDYRFGDDGAQQLITGIVQELATIFAPLFGTLVLCALLGGALQGPFLISWSRVTPKWSKLSPAAGMKRMFSVRALIELGKTLAKFGIVAGVAVWVLWPHAAALDTLIGADPTDVGTAAAHLIVVLVKSVAIAVAVIAGADLLYQRRSWLAKMRMTLQEVKDEHKESDGNPKVKAKIRQIGMQRARQRMMSKVPEASVVIVNPTHYAIALKYDHGRMGAPVVVAKGLDAVALRIRDLAIESGVPIVENRPLARALYPMAELDRPIPPDHYAAVAEVISYVMKLTRKRRPAG
jgi:flagellar biosynthetic protein FlhB